MFTALFIHLNKSLQLLVDCFHNMIRYFFTLKVLHELFDKQLLLIWLLVKVILERLIDLCILFLSLGLVLAEIVLFLKIRPNEYLVHKVTKYIIGLLLCLVEILLFVDLLQLVFVQLDKEAISVCILRHR